MSFIFPFEFQGQLWATQADNTADRLYTYACPPRHCQCQVQDTAPNSYCYNVFSEDSEDSLCTCGRSGSCGCLLQHKKLFAVNNIYSTIIILVDLFLGVFCGECAGNDTIGVTVLLNKCVSCDDGYSGLIVLFSESNILLVCIMSTIIIIS